MRTTTEANEVDALRRLWEAFGRHEKLRRERRAAEPPLTDAELLRMRIEESRSDIDRITAMFLATAVPLWVADMRCWTAERRVQVAHRLGEHIAYDQGIAAVCDPEARGTVKRGQLGLSFNALAQALGILAFCPGGIVFGGHHWEARS